ncbi:type I-F CRISPR-associated protein Csy3 [Moraxella sp. ZY210820]|uniref:type I-F CRISPR-associated protein Csy3 n=1 Tax=unclassified Moraxella TaxID=2685852 RepID=UPI0027319AA2|nr:type I-F CRISPR-associated protein Csy3 [Moraxella sp. ZY210820]WLF83388.1 type I-F CRISPR-associated protein Csy3 [Moraxella sp. ZY210820]
MAKAPKTPKAENKAPVPSVLAFSRKIEPSDGLMQAGLWNADVAQLSQQTWQNIELHDKSNRGVKSQYGVADEEKSQPNLVRGDDTSLPPHLDTLKVAFTVKFLGDIATATANNEPDFGIKLTEKFKVYQDEIGFLPLARRYAYNLVNGRFLWRNRVGAESVIVRIYDTENPTQEWIFDNARTMPLNDFEVENTKLDDLAKCIAESFATGKYLLLKAEAFVKVGLGQRVFPSQEMREKDKDNKSKFLYQIKTPNGLCAGLHSEKIGNAIRTIDTWYNFPQADDLFEKTVKPAIAIEPYGSVPTQGQAYRRNASEGDLYSLMANWLSDDGNISTEQKHFVVANLIRGGVFGGKDEDKDKKGKKQENKE